jgi:hypothetical protein
MEAIMRFVASLSLTLALSACAIEPPAFGPDTEVAVRPTYLSISVDDSVSAADKQTVQELINLTVRIITSERFARNLEGLEDPYHRLWLSPFGKTMSPPEVAQVYLGRHSTVRPAPIIVEVADQENPSQGFSRETPLVSYIVLPPFVLERWRGDTVERRSCAVNSLAHEISHSFSKSPVEGDHIFADRGKGWYFNLTSYLYGHLASYTIGTVAQCTMLQEANELEGEFVACLKDWGTDEFYSNGCGDPQSTST